MNPSNAIVVQTFIRTLDAEAAAAQLRGRGIEYLITSDDCGGMYPSLDVIKLLVAPEDAEAARAILGRPSESAEHPFVSVPEEQPVPGPAALPPRVYRFNSGLVAGVIVGVLLHISYTKYEQYRDRTDWYDRDKDGIADVWLTYRNGTFVEEQTDDNFDGKKDGWYSFSPDGFVTRAEADTDYNGVRDTVSIYTNGVTVQTDWKPNGTNVVLLRQLYRHGALHEELRDTSGDGRFDVSIIYDAFSTPVATNYLQLPLRSLQ